MYNMAHNDYTGCILKVTTLIKTVIYAVSTLLIYCMCNVFVFQREILRSGLTLVRLCAVQSVSVYEVQPGLTSVC